MSAFIVSKATMHRVVASIDERVGDKFAGMSLSNSKDLDALGQALFALNAAAVSQRYREISEEPIYRYRPLGKVPPTHQFKALSCLLYQCSEGDVPERPLYKALQELKFRVACGIAHRVAEGVPWDFPDTEAMP